MGLCTATHAQCLALRATLPATWITLLQVCQSAVFDDLEGACWSVPPVSAGHDCDGLHFAGRMPCHLRRESYEAKSSATALTTQICHFDGNTYADTGVQFFSCQGPKKHTKIFRGKLRWAPSSVYIPCPLPPSLPPPSLPFSFSPRRPVRAAKPHRYRLISFFQVDGPSSSLAVPLWYGARRGPRAPTPRGVCDGLRLPCGAALARWPLLDCNRMRPHTAMCAGEVLVLLSI